MFLLTGVAICAALSLPAHAAADDDRREVRKAGTCTASSRVNIRLRAEDGEIRVEVEIETRRATAAWKVILLHDRRIVYRGSVYAGSGGGRSLRLRRTLADWFGLDTIVVRASGPRLETCRVSATV
jgi:hypothetical protein